MSVMNTFYGRTFDPMEMTEENVALEDIARALSLLCRGGGHIRHFYSVAQHSINCAKEAKARELPERMQLACLLHDASEAYISDIIRPVKEHLNNYLEIEAKIMSVIWKHFHLENLTEEEQQTWKETDDGKSGNGSARIVFRTRRIGAKLERNRNRVSAVGRASDLSVSAVR